MKWKQVEYVKRDTELICECGFQWWEKLDFEVEQWYKARGTDGLFANAITACPKCGYEGLARGIIPSNSSPLKFYLKRKFSLYFPRGGWKPSPHSEISSNPANLEIPSLSVHLYEEPSSKTLDLKEIAHYLRHKFGNIALDLRGPFLSEISLSHTGEIAERLVKARIHDFGGPNEYVEHLAAEVETERRCLRNPDMKIRVVYEGFKLQAVTCELLGKDEFGFQHIHLIFTHRLFGTWDERDQRYHARISVYGFPNLISTTGIVEAPAKPRKFYRLKREGTKSSELKQQFRRRFVDYDDERLTEIMKGYVMQAIFYHLTGKPFCDDERCRLFNAHWQEEVIKAQLDKPEFCVYHEKMLEDWRKKSPIETINASFKKYQSLI